MAKLTFYQYLQAVRKFLGDPELTLTPSEIGLATFQFATGKPVKVTARLIIQKRK